MTLITQRSKALELFSVTKCWVSRFCLAAIPLTTLVTTLVMTVSLQPAKAQFNGCNGSDCVQYNLQTQAICTQVGTETSPNTPVGTQQVWYKGLNTELDNTILKGNIVAYKIQWSSGWSNWYVTGVNDIDVKFNPDKTMRRMWAYFTDHKYLYILCKQP